MKGMKLSSAKWALMPVFMAVVFCVSFWMGHPHSAHSGTYSVCSTTNSSPAVAEKAGSSEVCAP